MCVCFEGAYAEAKANFDFPDPRAAHAEFQTRCSSAVQEIQLRVQSIFSLRSDDLQGNTLPLSSSGNTHTRNIHTHDRRLSRALMWRREVSKVMHHQNTPGQLEVKRGVSPHADWLTNLQ